MQRPCLNIVKLQHKSRLRESNILTAQSHDEHNKNLGFSIQKCNIIKNQFRSSADQRNSKKVSMSAVSHIAIKLLIQIILLWFIIKLNFFFLTNLIKKKSMI